MKKRAVGLFFAIAAVWTAALLIRGHMAMPDILSGGKSVAAGKDGEVYISVSDRGKTGICRVKAGGTITGWYPSEQSAGIAGPIVCSGGSLYLVTPVRLSETGRPARWDIEKIDGEDGGRVLLGSFGRDAFSLVTDIRAEEGTVKVCGLSPSGDSILSATVGDEPQSTFYKLPAGESAKDAVYAADTVVALTERGTAGFFGAGGFQPIRPAAGNGNAPVYKLVRGADRAWSYDSGKGSLSELYPGTAEVIKVRPGVQMTDAWITDSGEYAILEKTDGGGGRLSLVQSGNENSYTKFKSGLPVLLALVRPDLVPVTLSVLACGIFLLLMWRAFGKNGRISLRLSLLSASLALFSGGLWIWIHAAWTGEKEELALWAGMIAILAILIYYTVIEWITRPLRELSAFADRISSGEYRVDKKMRSGDEVGRAWSALNRLCAVLSDKRYKYQALIDAQSRMIPASLAGLLGENSLSLLEPGSGKITEGTVGLLALPRAERSGKKAAETECRAAVEVCCRAMAAAESLGEAAAAVDGFRLSGTRILLPGGRDQAASLCRELSQSFREAKTGEPLRFDMMYLVHRTEYLLGVSGNTKRLIPYLLSSDVEWLESFLPDFQNSGVKAAATDAFLRSEGKPLECRHIGYLSSRDGKRKQRVYELLDACGNEEKRLKKKWSGYFQKGLRLYYSNDFYMARGVFSEILKECPFDGIVRWYLFAGEERFHAGGKKDGQHALFCGNSDR